MVRLISASLSRSRYMLSTLAAATMNRPYEREKHGACRQPPRGEPQAARAGEHDERTFWYTNQYYLTTSTFNWSTRIASIRFPGCQ